MEILKTTIEKLLALMGFEDASLVLEDENRKIAIFVDKESLGDRLPFLVNHLDYISKLIARKNNIPSVVVDINNYRKDRENIILDLAKAAARRALMTKETIDLPAMNAYERRLIHLELSMRPDVKTESIGDGEMRHVIVRPLS